MTVVVVVAVEMKFVVLHNCMTVVVAAAYYPDRLVFFQPLFLYIYNISEIKKN
jgi:hypothetical protein